MLHIHFLLQNIFFGVYEKYIYGESIPVVYQFDVSVAYISILYSTLCLVAFVLGYKIFYRRRSNLQIRAPFSVDISGCRKEIWWLNLFGIIVTLYMVVVIAITGGNYTSMTVIRAGSGFILELRVVYLLLLTHIMLNVPLTQFLMNRAFRTARFIMLTYVVAIILFQARSLLFELICVLVIPWLIWNGDKIKLKYLIALFCAMVVPNIMVLGRIGFDKGFKSVIDIIFSFEYTFILSKFMGAIISYPISTDGLSFVPQFSLLLIPSPLRDFFDFPLISYEFFEQLSLNAEISGGGFSLFAQFYHDFGWFAPVIFLLIGCLIGRSLVRTRFSGRVPILSSAGPLFYSGFLMAIRNDFAIFLKYSIQLFILAFILSYIVKTNLGKSNKLTPL